MPAERTRRRADEGTADGRWVIVGPMRPLTLLLLAACSAGTDPTGPDRDAPTAPDPMPAAALGPYAVGAWTVAFTDARGKDLVAEVWYPADVPAGTPPDPYPPTTLSGVGVRNAPPVAGGFPVIAFSHGSVAMRFQSVFLTEHLASHGFVVIAPDHPRNTLFDNDDDATVDVLLERPDDVRLTVDELLARSANPDEFLAGAVDDSGDYAAIGHSFGAVTVLALGGAAWDTAGLGPWCDENGGDSQACNYVDAIDPSLIDGHGGPDPRVIATVPMSPGLWYAFGPDGEALADVAMPLVLAGDADDILPYQLEARPVYDRLSSPRGLATFADAGHYPFSDMCRLAAVFQQECAGEADGWINIDTAQDATVTLVTAWIRRAFDQPGPGDDAVLDPASWTGPVTLELGD
jgi:predicted dienelactone hydrolase